MNKKLYKKNSDVNHYFYVQSVNDKVRIKVGHKADNFMSREVSSEFLIERKVLKEFLLGVLDSL